MRDLTRTRWAAVGAAVAITLGAGGVSLSQAAISSGEKPVVVTVDTTRILDTRTGLGLAGGRFVDSTPKDLQVTGNVPIAPSGTATVVPDGAVGVLVNVTVVAPDSKGFLSLRAGGATGVPSTSTVNFEAGITTPNAATVDLSADGKVQIWLETDNDGGSAHVLLDVVGYTVDHTHDDLYPLKTDVYTKAEVDGAINNLPTTLWAQTSGANTGVITRQSGGITLSHGGAGSSYFYTFPRDVTDCVWTASLGGAGVLDNALPVLNHYGISASQGSSGLFQVDPDEVAVAVFDQDDSSFTVAAHTLVVATWSLTQWRARGDFMRPSEVIGFGLALWTAPLALVLPAAFGVVGQVLAAVILCYWSTAALGTILLMRSVDARRKQLLTKESAGRDGGSAAPPSAPRTPSLTESPEQAERLRTGAKRMATREFDLQNAADQVRMTRERLRTRSV